MKKIIPFLLAGLLSIHAMAQGVKQSPWTVTTIPETAAANVGVQSITNTTTVYNSIITAKPGTLHQIGLVDNGINGGDILVFSRNTAVGSFTNAVKLLNLRGIGDSSYGFWRGTIPVIINGGTNNWSQSVGDGLLQIENDATMQSGSGIGINMMGTNADGSPLVISQNSLAIVAVSTNASLGANESAGFLGLIANPGFPLTWAQVRNVGGTLGNYGWFDMDAGTTPILYFPYWQANKYNHLTNGFQAGIAYFPLTPSLVFSNAALYYDNNTLSNVRFGAGASGGGGMAPFVMESSQFIDLSKGSPNRQVVATNALFSSRNADSGAATIELIGNGTGLYTDQDQKGFHFNIATAPFFGIRGSNSGTNVSSVWSTAPVNLYASTNRVAGDLTVTGKVYNGTAATVFWSTGSGSPENVVTAPVGSIYSRTDGGANTSFYVKESGTGNTGWIGK